MDIGTWVIIGVTVVLFVVKEIRDNRKMDEVERQLTNAKEDISGEVASVASEVGHVGEVLVNGQKNQENKERFESAKII